MHRLLKYMIYAQQQQKTLLRVVPAGVTVLVGLPGGCVDVEGSDVVGGTPVAGRYRSMSYE